MIFKVDKSLRKIIIGHTGYIGSSLLKEIDKEDDCILGISRTKSHLKYQTKNKNFLEIESDIFKDNISEELNFKAKPTIYICAHNLQTDFTQRRKNLNFVYHSNRNFYINFVNNIKKFNPGKLIFLSSGGSLYSSTKASSPSDEGSIINPVSEYGLSKFILENFLINFSKEYEIPLLICRVSTIYGDSPSIRKFGFINYLKQCALKNISPVIYGKDTYRDYLHIKDLINILMKISKKNLLSNTYNISYGKSYSCFQIYEKVKEYLNQSGIELKDFQDQGIREGENNKIFISSNKLKNEIFWKPKININEGIKEISIN